MTRPIPNGAVEAAHSSGEPVRRLGLDDELGAVMAAYEDARRIVWRIGDSRVVSDRIEHPPGSEKAAV